MKFPINVNCIVKRTLDKGRHVTERSNTEVENVEGKKQVWQRPDSEPATLKMVVLGQCLG